MIGKCKILLFLVLTTLCFACNKNEKDKFSISGVVTGFPDGTKLYLRNLTTDSDFDSTIVKNNRFKFEGFLNDTPEQLWLHSNVDKKFIYTNLLIGNDDVTIEGDISDFPRNVSITGSKIQENFNYSRSLTKDYLIKRDSLVNAFIKLPNDKKNTIGSKIWKEVRVIDSITDKIDIDYIKSHGNTYVSVINLGYLKNRLHKDTIQNIFDNYNPEIKSSKYAKVIEVYLNSKISKIGDKYHDFEGLNQKEEHVKFSKIKGHYTLLDFTAAFCGPCIESAEELAKINKQYSDSLTIVSFSQDPKKDVWLKSLERDKVAWNSVWDGKGIYSETSIKYGISGIPTFILINPEGLIIEKWSGYGKGSILNKLKKTSVIPNDSIPL